MSVGVGSRPYADDDLPEAQAALASWIGRAGPCGYCHPGDLAHRIYEGLAAAPRPVGELVSVWVAADGSVAGIAICGRFDAVFDAFVAPEHRGSDVELAVLRSARETTRRSAVGDEVPVATDVYTCDRTRVSSLEQLGFEDHRLWDHVTSRPLSDPIDAPAVPDGFIVRPATMDDHGELAAVRNDAFGTRWTAEAFRDAVMRKPGYRPEREIVAVAPDGQVAASAVTWLDPVNRVGLFEPVATRSTFRRLGLARALMLSGLRALREQGMTTAAVEHAADNRAALELYRSLGFRKLHETRGYRLVPPRPAPAG